MGWFGCKSVGQNIGMLYSCDRKLQLIPGGLYNCLMIVFFSDINWVYRWGIWSFPKRWVTPSDQAKLADGFEREWYRFSWVCPIAKWGRWDVETWGEIDWIDWLLWETFLEIWPHLHHHDMPSKLEASSLVDSSCSPRFHWWSADTDGAKSGNKKGGHYTTHIAGGCPYWNWFGFMIFMNDHQLIRHQFHV